MLARSERSNVRNVFRLAEVSVSMTSWQMHDERQTQPIKQTASVDKNRPHRQKVIRPLPHVVARCRA